MTIPMNPSQSLRRERRGLPSSSNNQCRQHHTPSNLMQICTGGDPYKGVCKFAHFSEWLLRCANLHTGASLQRSVQICTLRNPHIGMCKFAHRLSGLPSPWVTANTKSKQGSFAALSHFWSLARHIGVVFIPLVDTCDWRCTMI